MKKLLLIVLLACPLALPAQQILDLGLFNAPMGSDKLEVRIKPTQNVSNGAYTAGVFTVRFLSSYGITLTAPAALNNPLFRYAVANQGTDGTYSYYSLSFVTPFTVNWNSGTEYPIAILKINSGCGSGNGTFEIINNAWTFANNGNIYQELNGIEAQNIIYQATVSAPLGIGSLDMTPPSVTCPANQTVSTDLNRCTYTHLDSTWNALGTDNCPGFILQYLLSGATTDTFFTLEDAVFNKGLTNLNVTITDGAGLRDSCSFTVTVIDSLLPVISAPPAVIVPANAPFCLASGVALGTPIFSDNCPGAQVTSNAPTAFPLGNTTVVWTATDAGGLTATATQSVTVQSNLAANALNLSNDFVCTADTAELSFGISGGVGPYTVVFTSNGTPTTLAGYASNQPILVTPAATTGYQLLSVTDSMGCSFAPLGLTDTLTVLPSPTLSSLQPSNTSVCQGDSITFTANGLLPNVSTSFQYTLTPGGPGTQTGQSSPAGTFTFAAASNSAGGYSMSISAISVNGCTTNFSTGNTGTYTVQASPTLSSLQASVALVCQGDSVSFVANGLIPNALTAFNYTLQPGGSATQTGTSSSGGSFNFPLATNLPGIYGMTIQSVAINGCSTSFSSNNTATYTVKPSPTLSSLQPSSAAVCQGEPVFFTANGLLPNDTTIFNYILAPGGPATQTAVSSAAGTYMFAPSTNPAGVYAMSIQSISVNGCSTNFSNNNSGTYTVSSFPTIDSLVTSANSLCFGATAYFIATGLPPDVSVNVAYTLNGVPGTTTGLSNSAGTVNLLSAIYPEGTYTLIITAVSVAGCSTTSSLSATVIVDPFQAACGFTVAGKLAIETGKGVEESFVNIAGMSNSIPFTYTDFTDTTGRFDFVNTIPLASDYILTPSKNDNPLNGVTTYDLVLISKHILGTEPLGSPYKIIAADANKSNSVTTFDIVEFRKLILGIYTELPNNKSWRFVDQDFVFPNPANPFATSFPVTITRSNLQANALNEDFVAVKVGDVNGTAALGLSAEAEVRTTGETLWFDLEISGNSRDGNIKAGEIFSVFFRPSEQVFGYQFTLDIEALEVLDIKPGAGMSADNFGVFREAVTCSYVSENPGQTGGFSITFRAMANGALGQMLRFSSRITPAQAYNAVDAEMTAMEVNGRFSGFLAQNKAFELYQNRPNPFSGSTQIPFYLPAPDVVRLSVFDGLGSVLYSVENSFELGQNSFELHGDLLAGTGILFYKIESSTAAAVRKMMKN